MAVKRKPAAGEAVATAAAPPEAEMTDRSWKPGLLARLVFDVTGIAAGAGYLMLALDLGTGSASAPGAGFFPVAVGVLIEACLLTDLAMTARAMVHGVSMRGTGRIPVGAVVVLGVIPLYLALVETLGHALTGSVAVALMLTALGNRKWWSVALIGLASGFASDLLFTALLGLRLPAGDWNVGWSAWM